MTLVDIDATPGDEVADEVATAVRSGTNIVLLLCAATVVLSFGAPSLAGKAFIPGALVATWWVRRRPAAVLSCIVWLWLLTPEIRRIVDWRAGFAPSNPIMLAPAVATFVLLPAALGRPMRGSRRLAFAITIGFLVIVTGLVNGIILNGATAALAAFAYWFPPVIVGLYVLGLPDRRLMRGFLQSWLGPVMIGLSIYGLIQFLILPAWDADWMRNVNFVSIGRPEPLKVRIFGPLGSPFAYGTTLAFGIVALVGTRVKLRWPIMAVATVALGLSQVRSAWIGAAAGMAALVVMSRRDRRAIAVALILPVAMVSLVGGSIANTIRDRYQNSASKGLADGSLVARIQFHLQIIPPSLAKPAGEGLGSTGVAAVLATSHTNTIVSFDGTLPETLFAFGGIGGLLYLVVLVAAGAGIIRRCRGRTGTVAATGAALTVLLVEVLFGNVLVQSLGVVLFLFMALTARDCEDIA